MTASRRSIANSLRALAQRPAPTPDDAFVDRLEQRLRAFDIDTARPSRSNVVAFRRRLTRGAAIGVVAGVMTAAGAAAVAIVTVRHITDPAPQTTAPTRNTTSPAHTPHSTLDTTPIPTAPAPTPPVTTVPVTTVPVTTVPVTTVPGSLATTPATETPSTVAPATVAPTTLPVTTVPVEPPPPVVTLLAPTEPPPTNPQPTEPPPTTEVHTAAAMELGCTASGGSVACSWSAVPDGTDHVVVLRSTPSEARGRVLVPGAGDTSIVDSSASPGLAYTYLVHALDAAGHSIAHSNAVTVTCCD